MTTAGTGSPPVGPLALLFGGATCVACLSALAFAASAVFGVSVIPATLFDGVWGYGLAALFLVAFGFVAVRGHRRAQTALERGEAPDPYWSFHPRRGLASFGLALAGVTMLALTAQFLVNALTPFTYTILWGRTVPFIALALAWIMHGEWNRRVMST